MSGSIEDRPRGLFARLIHADDKTADSIVLAGLVMGLAYCLICGWDVAMNGREFSPTGFGTGAGLILGAIGGAKTLRDRVGRPDPAPAGTP